MLRCVGAGASIPRANMIDADAYHKMLEAAGFSAIECRSIGADVVPGFHRFVEKHFNALAHVTAAKDWYKLRAVAWLLNKGHATKAIDFVIVSATNGAISAIALRCMRGMNSLRLCVH